MQFHRHPIRGGTSTPGDPGLLIGWDDTFTRRKTAPGFAGPGATPKRDPAPVYHDGEGHLMTIAPTGSGKGTGAVIPTLLSYRGPVVVVDPKGENHAVTARRRRDMGQKIVVLDPFEITGAVSDTVNPLDLIDRGDGEAIDTAALLAELIVKPAPSITDPFWDDRARQLITALLLHVVISRPPVLRNLAEVRYLLNQSKEDMQFTVKEMQKSPNEDVRQAASILSTPADRTIGSIMSTAQNHCDFLRGSRIPSATARSSFDLDAIRNGENMTVYLVLPPERLETHAQLLRLWIGLLLNSLLKRRSRCVRNTLFIIDEAAQLGPLNELRRIMTLMRGYGVTAWTFWQDMSQLKSTYPHDWESLFNNCRVHTAFGLNNLRMARQVADVYGTIDGEGLLELDPGDQLTMRAGSPPKLLRRPNYLEDAMFEGMFDANPFFAPPGHGRTELGVAPRKGGFAPAATNKEALEYQVGQWLEDSMEEGGEPEKEEMVLSHCRESIVCGNDQS